MKKYIWIFAILFVIGLICGSGCSTYNSIVTLDEQVEKTWADVQTQYQRRADLIPNLVETVKGYATHEQETLEGVIAARSGLTDAYQKAQALREATPQTQEEMDTYNDAQQGLNRALGIYINAVHEAYPDLKANQNFRDLQVQLEGTENRIATERRNYNDAVQKYNLKIRRFPASIWAGIFGFDKRSQFKADADAQSAPKVQF